MTKYRNEDLNINFVANNYEDHALTDVEEEAPTDLKKIYPLMTHATSEGVVLKAKVLDGYRADYSHEVRNSVTWYALNYKPPVIEYPKLTLNRALEKLSECLPQTQDDFSHLTKFDNVNLENILSSQLVNFDEIERKPAETKQKTLLLK